MDVWQQRTADDPALARQLRSLLDRGFLSDAHPHVVVHDLGKMSRRTEVLKSVFCPGTLHTVAIKANPLLGVLKRLVDQGLGLEAASAGEIELALAAGCPTHKIVFDSPAKTRPELRRAHAMGCLINANSEAELERLVALGRSCSGYLGVRCNPGLVEESRESTTMVATPNSKFGVPIERLPDLLERFPTVNGLHIHVGSQVATASDLLQAAQKLVEVADRFPNIEWLDIGGGLPTRYREGDPGLCPGEYWSLLRQHIPSIANYRLITENGRSLQAGCGWAASRVEYVEEGRMIVHFGADFALRECYQSDSWWHEMELLTSRGLPKSGELSALDIYGPLCFSGDRLASKRLLPKPDPGDIFLLHDCGAYTLSMWSRYCSRSMPGIVGLDGDEVVLLKAPESAGALVDFWS